MLELKNIKTFYGNIQALKDVSLKISEGEIITLIGANGAGKSTTLMSICGIVSPRSGEIIFMGEPIQNMAPNNIVSLGISQVPEGRRIFPYLSVAENLDMGAFLRNDKDEIKRDIEYIYELFPILAERRTQAGGTLSGGEQQMLAISRALMAKPRLLLMDEPSLGLAPLLVNTIFDIIREINTQGTSILLIEQNVYHALDISVTGYVLENGRIALSGTGQELLENPHIKTTYLGL